MNASTRVTVLAFCLGAMAVGSNATAQRRRPPRPRVDAGVAAAGPVDDHRVIAIPVVDAFNMFQRMRVWMLTPPAGSTAFGINTLGQGDRVWVLLPSCRTADPDDPRDPCPVGRVQIELITGTGQVQTVGPVDLAGPNSRRVQSFVIPVTADVVRLKLLRNDGSVRYEAAVHREQLHNLPAPEGTPRPNGFAFDLTRYPAS